VARSRAHDAHASATNAQDDPMTMYERTGQWMDATGRIKNKPNITAQVARSLDCVASLAEFLSAYGDANAQDLESIRKLCRRLAISARRGQTILEVPNGNREVVLLSMSELAFAMNGLAYLLGMNKEGADEALMQAYESIVGQSAPSVNADGKLTRPDGWRDPDLSGMV
jgi:hypothetical protein